MDNDKALIVVEPAQSSQVVAVSDVSAAEIEYQKMIQQYKEPLRQKSGDNCCSTSCATMPPPRSPQ